jgi:hypothetical protein
LLHVVLHRPELGSNSLFAVSASFTTAMFLVAMTGLDLEGGASAARARVR